MSLGVHDGVFHADEVTAAALLLLYDLIKREKIVRSRDPAILREMTFVCDVGGEYNPKKKRFDHHQASYKEDLSSAGMVLRYLKEENFLEESFFEFLNRSLILGVDAHDNGLSPQISGLCSFSHVIANFNPIEEVSDELQNQAFFEALDFAYGHLDRLKKRYFYNLSCRKLIEEQMKQNKLVLIFDQNVSWFESFFALGGEKHPALFLIMPTKEGWKLRGIPPSYKERMKVRLPLPLVWAGLLQEELQKKTGIAGAIFCHKGRFTSVWKEKKDAIFACKLVLKMHRMNYEDNF